MNGKDYKDLKTVSDGLNHMMKKIDDIRTLLKGKDDSDDIGLVGAVHDNTKFRMNTKKWMGFIGLSVLGLLVKAIYDLIITGPK